MVDAAPSGENNPTHTLSKGSPAAKGPPGSPSTHKPDSEPVEATATASQAPQTPQLLKRTPLYDVHVALGAKIVPFAGFEMPVQYPTGITAEHRAVREKAGLFDVSHMGEFIVRGPRAVEFVNHVTTNDVATLKPGQAQYSTILREDGTIVTTVWCIAPKTAC
jgi:hypothetical protein